jgi:hypothetical protein
MMTFGKYVGQLEELSLWGKHYHNCIRMHALCVIAVMISAILYADTGSRYSVLLTTLAGVILVFAHAEMDYLGRKIGEVSEPVLMEIAQIGKEEPVENPDPLLYACEMCLTEFKYGYLTARAAHNINTIIARLLQANCCNAVTATKFYRVLKTAGEFHVWERICGLWPLSVFFIIGSVIHRWGMSGDVGMELFMFLPIILPYVYTAREMTKIYQDRYMSSLYYDDVQENGDAFIEYVNKRCEGA